MHGLTSNVIWLTICCLALTLGNPFGFQTDSHIHHSYYRSESGKALVHMAKDNRTNQMTDCEVFGDPVVISELLKSIKPAPVLTTVTKKDDFTQLVKECRELQNRSWVENLVKTVQEIKNLERGKGKASKETIDYTVILQGIYPGTLWCGAGNIADEVDDLGDYNELDVCCREHDQCDRFISGFNTADQYGSLFNPDPWTRSHCDCDELFKGCLRTINTFHGTIVGRMFFDFLELKCFKFGFPNKCVLWTETSILDWFADCLKYRPDIDGTTEWHFHDQLGYWH